MLQSPAPVSPSSSGPLRALAPPSKHQQQHPRSVRETRLYRALQTENDTLRFQLLQAQQERDGLRQELETMRALPSQTSPSALEERCRLLADRLLFMTRDKQVSQSAEVLFLLRCQQEERQFLLETLADVLQDMGIEPAGEETGAVHTHILSQRATQVGEGLHSMRAALALERARSRLCLEHIERMVHDIQDAVMKATRTVFEAATRLGDAAVLLPPESSSGALTLLGGARASYTPSSERRELAFPFSGGDGSATSEPPTPLRTVIEDLGWSCDALKASHRGLEAVLSTVRGSMRAQTPDTATARAPSSPLPPAGQQQQQQRGRSGSQATSDSATTAIDSPEMDQLLSSFRAELFSLQMRSAQSHERIAKRLSRELKHHYEASKQYESRIRLLEAENSKLLLLQEREHRERQHPPPMVKPEEPPVTPERANMTTLSQASGVAKQGHHDVVLTQATEGTVARFVAYDVDMDMSSDGVAEADMLTVDSTPSPPRPPAAAERAEGNGDLSGGKLSPQGTPPRRRQRQLQSPQRDHSEDNTYTYHDSPPRRAPQVPMVPTPLTGVSRNESDFSPLPLGAALDRGDRRGDRPPPPATAEELPRTHAPKWEEIRDGRVPQTVPLPRPIISPREE